MGGNSQEGSTIWADGLEDGLNIDKIRLPGTSVVSSQLTLEDADKADDDTFDQLFWKLAPHHGRDLDSHRHKLVLWSLVQ